ncbi:hypothetical protein GCM10011321_28330 [Youhaiella tibetensis]|uniref:Gamma-glutamylcyclotransferase n=1 Tax=Paradevosia tibetensis TaxID=1447062 RepID=A0A5B9DJ95_9HYPH|nr:gamma-glutamylcyclotransferase family protein [Youhaiella tibetensis]QEE19173.1 gamma-glutamylcyclotransferase [Youhaiella tibetensis]GGF35590.1 hypothetical protein GCM10011321_28330 [Youhaiella tibetensis]
MSQIVHFAYRSNMFTPRLRFRILGCVPVGRASLSGHRLAYHKLSKKDGLGKCSAASSDAPDVVHGVLFHIPEDQLPDLHRAEGRGHAMMKNPWWRSSAPQRIKRQPLMDRLLS